MARPAAILVAGAACLLTTSATPLHSGPVSDVAVHHHKAAPAKPAVLAKIAPEPQIVPQPVSMTAGRGWFRLTRGTRIVAGSAAVTAVASDLAGYLRPATGYPLPVATGSPHTGDIALKLGNPGIKASTHGEGYRIDASPAGVTAGAQTTHGLYDAIQTLRQMLPVWIFSTSKRPGPWLIPAVHITDYPRYAYRGLMLDFARHYEPPSAVERLIGQAAADKIDVLHLHLSDDQGFRLVINGFPRLSKTGGRGSVGTQGRVMDPGGFWTQAQYRAVVADAAAHFITVVPEVDSPGHDNAIIMSEYNDDSNPRLSGNRDDINCSTHNPPVWDYTQDVGYSALCPGSQNTWVIESNIINQLTALSPGPYYDIGGDEVPATVLSQAQYAEFVSKEATIVHAHGKTLMGWADIAGPGTKVPPGSVAEYWEPVAGSASGTITAREAVAKGMKIVMSPADHAYLDQKYLAGTRGDQPPGLGQIWACGRGCDLDAAYDWDPGGFVTGVTDRNVIGVEGAVWTETLVDLSTADYMTFPRLAALAEVAWSPAAKRYKGSPANRSFMSRMTAVGGRLMAAGINFYPSTLVGWHLDGFGSALTANGRTASGTVATVAAPGIQPGAVFAAIHWGDGTT
ncbi:MAG TPA: beta-N-acetylhexosaminidase, partial [Streptosporangiaceae bacterium]